jgi:glycosyltransferase involved in cell wall biosynthesis
MKSNENDPSKLNMPSVSIIIPTYNRADLLPRAIDSVLCQSYQDIEIIVVDDASSDSTCNVIQKYIDKKLIYIRRSVKGGGGVSRNTGIQRAKGNYIAFLDDDDEWMPDKLLEQIQHLKGNPRCGMVYTGYFIVDSRTSSMAPNKKYEYVSYEALLKENCVGPTSTYLIRKSCFDNVGLFDESLPSCQDWDLLIRLAKRYPISVIDKPLVKYYTHNDRITTNYANTAMGKELLLSKILPELKSRPQALSKHYFVLGNLYCHNGNMLLGRKKLMQAIKACPSVPKYYGYFIIALLGFNMFQHVAAMYGSFKKKKYKTS